MKLNSVVAEVLVALGFFACVSIPSRLAKVVLLIFLLPAIVKEFKAIGREERAREDIS
ncbi:MAG: hypothetical protein V2A55_02435 [Candidatus Jorgensenbacteria bacterium]